MIYYVAKPQVAGELGPLTEILTVYPTTVGKMQYCFDQWPSDDLVEAHPCFAVREELRAALVAIEATGVNWSECLVGKTDNFESEVEDIPPYFRLEPVGKLYHDDFSLNTEHQLVISERVVRVLANFRTEFLSQGDPIEGMG